MYYVTKMPNADTFSSIYLNVALVFNVVFKLKLKVQTITYPIPGNNTLIIRSVIIINNVGDFINYRCFKRYQTLV